MLDYPTTAFLSASLRAFVGALLLLTTAWLFYRLALPQPEFDGQRLNDVLNHLVDNFPRAGYWTNSRTHVAQDWLKLDSYFVLSYSALLSVVCGWLSQTTPSRLLARTGALLSWGVLFGAALDLAENGALVGLLALPGHALSRALAHALRLLKWLPLLLTAAYVLAWLGVMVVRKMSLR